MLHDNEGPNASGQWGVELGINTIPVYLDTWKDQEPTDDAFTWDSAIPGNAADYGHCIARIGILHVLAWSRDKIPDWVDPSDIDGNFKTEFGEYVETSVGELVSRDIRPDLYLMELEANYAGHELPESVGNKTNAWIIDWMKWEADLIRGIDSNARICCLLTPTEFRPEESLDNTGDLGKILMRDFIGGMISAGVHFDAFGFNVASGVYDNLDDWTVFQTALDGLMAQFDKSVYIWGMGYPADNTGNPVFHHPRTEGYSEAWQADQYVQSLQYLLNTPGVLGVGIDLFDYQEGFWTAPVLWGLVGGNRQDPSSLTKRASFNAVRDFWNENCR